MEGNDWRLTLQCFRFENNIVCKLRLDNATVDRLEFGFTTKIGNNGNTKWVKINDDDDEICCLKIRRNDNSALRKSDILIEDIKVQIRYI